MNIITDPADTPIKPVDIDASQHFFDAFGEYFTEVSARLLVLLMQEGEGVWRPVTQDEVDKMDSKGTFLWNDLVPHWVQKDEDGFFRVSLEFVVQCYKSRPLMESKV